MVRNPVASLFFAIVMASCGRTSGGDSLLKHRHDDLPRTRSTPFAPHGPANCSDKFSAHCKYVRGLFKMLTDGNADIFKGEFAAEKFTISVLGDHRINAFADPSNGMIYFLTGIFPIFANDAQALSVLAHESSHVLMRHDLNYDSDDHPYLQNDPTWKQKKQRFLETNRDLEIARLVLEKSRDTLLERRHTLVHFFADRLTANVANLPTELKDKLKDVNQGQDELLARLKLRESDLLQLLATNSMNDPATQAKIDQLRADIEMLNQKIVKNGESIARLVDALDHANSKLEESIEDLINKHVGGFAGILWRQSKVAINDLKQKIKDITEVQDTNYSALTSYAKEKLGYDYDIYNWAEAEADQAGLEMFIKAGFDPAEYAELFVHFMDNPSAESECRNLIQRARQGETVPMPARGKYGHPFSCWRAFNVGVTEMKLHKDVFAPYLPQATKKTVFPGELDQLKKI